MRLVFPAAVCIYDFERQLCLGIDRVGIRGGRVLEERCPCAHARGEAVLVEAVLEPGPGEGNTALSLDPVHLLLRSNGLGDSYGR